MLSIIITNRPKLFVTITIISTVAVMNDHNEICQYIHIKIGPFIRNLSDDNVILVIRVKKYVGTLIQIYTLRLKIYFNAFYEVVNGNCKRKENIIA